MRDWSFDAADEPSIRAQHRKVSQRLGFQVLVCHHSVERGQKQDTHTHTHTLFALQHVQTVFSVRLPQTANFCQVCRLNLVFSFQEGVGWWWWLVCEFVNISVSVNVNDVKEMSRWRGEKKRREERWCWVHQEEAESDASPCSCSQTPTLFLLE